MYEYFYTKVCFNVWSTRVRLLHKLCKHSLLLLLLLLSVLSSVYHSPHLSFNKGAKLSRVRTKRVCISHMPLSRLHSLGSDDISSIRSTSAKLPSNLRTFWEAFGLSTGNCFAIFNCPSNISFSSFHALIIVPSILALWWMRENFKLEITKSKPALYLSHSAFVGLGTLDTVLMLCAVVVCLKRKEESSASFSQIFPVYSIHTQHAQATWPKRVCNSLVQRCSQ